MSSDPEAILRSLFQVALEAVSPEHLMASCLPIPGNGRTIVVGAGKASAAMAAGFEAHWQGDLEGMVITRYGHGVPCRSVEIVEAAHPVPEESGLNATRSIISLVESAGPDDLVVCLFSGGGSALMCAPAAGIGFGEKQEITSSLLKSGATISEMNCVRTSLSAIKGGRLAALAAPARVETLVISDVPGDDPSCVASGPSVPGACDADPVEIIRRYSIDASASLIRHLNDPASRAPPPDDPVFARAETKTIASAQMALDSSAKSVREHGYEPYILSDRIEGEARDVARVLGAIGLQVAKRHQPFSPPCVLLSGGETTVSVRGEGRGGRNVEFLLELACVLEGAAGIHAIACDTDGIDGQEDVAGAVIGPDILDRARDIGLDPHRLLENNDGHRFFKAMNAQVITGPTLTNVNDFRAILIDRIH